MSKKFKWLLIIILILGSVLGACVPTQVVVTPSPPPTPVEIVVTATPLPKPTSSFITFADTAKVSEELVHAEGVFVELKPQEVALLIGNPEDAGPGFGVYTSAAENILSLDIPLSEGFMQPCASGRFRGTAPFGQVRSYGSHKGRDLVCEGSSDLQAISSSVVWRVYQNLGYTPSLGAENHWTFDFDVSGRTYILAARLPKEYFPEAVTEPGDTVVVIAIYGHMEEPIGGEPSAGSILNAGDWIGRMGWTGYVLPEGVGGTHLHFGTGLVLSNGSILMFNPARLIPELQ